MVGANPKLLICQHRACIHSIPREAVVRPTAAAAALSTMSFKNDEERSLLLPPPAKNLYGRSHSAGSKILRSTAAAYAGTDESPSLSNSQRRPRGGDGDHHHHHHHDDDDDDGSHLDQHNSGSLIESVRGYFGGSHAATEQPLSRTVDAANNSAAESSKAFLFYIVYAVVNVIISGTYNIITCCSLPYLALFCNCSQTKNFWRSSTMVNVIFATWFYARFSRCLVSTISKTTPQSLVFTDMLLSSLVTKCFRRT